MEPLETRYMLSGTPAYALNTIGHFGVNSTGANPYSTLIADSAGNLYGTCTSGGAYGAGTIFEIPAGSNTLTTLASFDGADGNYPWAGVAMDAAGNLYGTTRWGGASNNGVVFEVTRGSGTVTPLASFSGADGANPLGGVVLDPSGNLFGTTAYGGSANDGTVFEIAAGSNTITTLASFNGTNGANPFSAPTLDAAGNLYGTADGGGAGDGTVFEIPKGSTAITTVASFYGTNGVTPYGGVILDAAGNLYGTTLSGGANQYYGTVFKIAKGSNAITTLASFGGSAGQTPNGVTQDSAGNLYGTTYGDTVFEVPAGSNTITTLARLSGPDGGAPYDRVTLDAAGNLYGTTSAGGAGGAGAVFELAKGSSAITPLVSFSPPGAANPTSLTSDAAGNLYGTTKYGGANNDGAVFEIANGSGAVTILTSFNGTNGANPGSLALDAAGNLYGTTAGGGASGAGTVFEIAAGSNTITTLASFNITDGSGPNALMLDAAGDLYGTTYYGGSGSTSPFSGNGTAFEIVSGSGTITALASFNSSNGANPMGSVALDSDGNLYGTTYRGGASGDGTVFEIAKGSAAISTLGTFNYTNGANPQAGVVVDAAGNLYGATNTSTGGHGTVFEVARGSNTIQTLALFNSTDVEYPNGMMLDASGNLYGTTSRPASGTDRGAGSVFELVKGTSTILTLASFNGLAGAGYPSGGVILDSAGNVYGTTYSGGAGDDGTVFELTPVATITSPATAVFTGDTETLDLSYSGPGTPQSWSINWGDGSPVQVVAGNASSATHVYPVSSAFTISATVSTFTGTSGPATAPLMVYPAPTLNGGTLSLFGTFGNDSLSFTNSGGTFTVDFSGAVHQYSGSSVSMAVYHDNGGNDTINVTGPTPATLYLSAGNDSIAAAGGPVTLNPGTGSLALTINSGTVTIPANSGTGIRPVNFSNLSIGAAGTFRMAASSSTVGDYSRHANRSVAVISAGGLSVASGGTLDLEDNDLVLRYTPTLAGATAAKSQVNGLLTAAFDGGLWDGPGLTSFAAAADASGTRALGWGDNLDLGLSSFDGVDVSDGTEILVKFTYYGDATLDGKVDAADNSQVAAGLQNTGTGWAFGDFDYSGGKPTAADNSLFAGGLAGYKQFGVL